MCVCVCVCVRVSMCVRVCARVCVNANAREEHLSWLSLFVIIIYKSDPRAGECLNVY